MKNFAAIALALSLVSFSGFADEEVVTETPVEVVNNWPTCVLFSQWGSTKTKNLAMSW